MNLFHRVIFCSSLAFFRFLIFFVSKLTKYLFQFASCTINYYNKCAFKKIWRTIFIHNYNNCDLKETWLYYIQIKKNSIRIKNTCIINILNQSIEITQHAINIVTHLHGVWKIKTSWCFYETVK